METLLPLLFFNQIICAIIGFRIGKSKERSAQGLILGLCLGWIGLIILFRLPSLKAAINTSSPMTTNNFSDGQPTFVWKELAIYSEKEIFTFKGKEYPISSVRKVAYETQGTQGCMGGRLYYIHIHLNDVKNPRLTMSSRNITSGENRTVEENYERILLLMNCTG